MWGKAAAERVFQLGDGEFLPLRSLYRTNLPVPATTFLGRERELADVVGLLAREDLRVLTLTGPGGTGKTRLALQAAAEAFERYPDGIWWVPLASLRDPSAVPAQIAQSLGATVEPSAHIADKRMLLVIDNFEHLLDAVRGVGVLLGTCPNLQALATSRELLQLQGEHAYAAPTLTDEDGTTLFLSRALAVEGEVGDNGTVGELCRRLDNLPLAIELAAARTRHLSPAQLLDRLSQKLDLLKAGRDADPRQQTLRATIEWSYELLGARERQLFARLSVFAGGCTLGAAEEVCETDLETLSSLVDQSLVRRTGERFWMLETIRELATERLEDSDEKDAIRARHAQYYLALAESAGLSADSELQQRHVIVLPERDNMRAALEWARESGDRELGLSLVVALENFWATQAPLEGAQWAAALLEAAGDDAPPELRARALRVQGGMNNLSGNIALSREVWEQSLAIHRSRGDERASRSSSTASRHRPPRRATGREPRRWPRSEGPAPHRPSTIAPLSSPDKPLLARS